MTSRHVRESVLSLVLKLLFFTVGVGSVSARVAVETEVPESLRGIFPTPFEEDHLNNIIRESNG